MSPLRRETPSGRPPLADFALGLRLLAPWAFGALLGLAALAGRC